MKLTLSPNTTACSLNRRLTTNKPHGLLSATKNVKLLFLVTACLILLLNIVGIHLFTNFVTLDIARINLRVIFYTYLGIFFTIILLLRRFYG